MLVGVTGPIASGTDSFGKILVEKGFIWFSYSDLLREEMRKKGIELTRKNLQDYGDFIRKKNGEGVLSKILISKMENGKNYVVGNIRNPGEVDELRKISDFVLVLINVPINIRFNRAVKRKRENEPIIFEEFKKLDEKDLGINQPKHGQQHGAVFKMVDKIIVNDGSLEELRRKTERFLEKLKKQNS